MLHAPSRGVDFRTEGAGCTSTRRLSLPLISTRLGLEKARAPPTPEPAAPRQVTPCAVPCCSCLTVGPGLSSQVPGWGPGHLTSLVPLREHCA